MVGGILDSVVQTARRRAQDREPRALLYDASGRPRMVRAGDPGGDRLIAAAAGLIDLATSPPPVAGDDEADEAAAAEAETQADAAAAEVRDEPGETPA